MFINHCRLVISHEISSGTINKLSYLFTQADPIILLAIY